METEIFMELDGSTTENSKQIELLNKLKQIKDIYVKLNINDNVVLGGSASLLLHGLHVHKTPEDLDLIIYSPTKEQLNILDTLSIFCEKNTIPKYNRRSYKLTHNNLKIDILVEHRFVVPPSLLEYNIDGTRYKVQSIKEVFYARKRYNKEQIREKDIIASLRLKELNFNVI